MIFYATGDPAYNTSPPTGTLADSGWQWVGTWNGFQGTPIGPHHFIAARHVGGAVGDLFVLHGASYATVAFADDPSSDLRIWTVAGAFPSWAPLYRTNDEVGKPLVVFGRGLNRGAEVRDAATGTLRGWQWGPSDGKMRWGQNTVVAVMERDASWGSQLYAVFNAQGGRNVAHLALGDSSGPVFLRDDSGWKLAGVASSVDSLFNVTDSGPGFMAAVFDSRGLFFGRADHWKKITGTAPTPSGFYATRISTRTAWIDQVLSSGEVAPVVFESGSQLSVASGEAPVVSTGQIAGWRPPQRYKSMMLMAALGNVEKQLQLATSLMQETDLSVRDEGVKWLQTAAANGSRDAQDLLQQNREQLVRPDRDRDRVRVARCCPVPGR